MISIQINNDNVFSNFMLKFNTIVVKNIRKYATKYYLRIISKIKNDEIRPKSLSSALGKYPTLYKTGSFVQNIKMNISDYGFTIYSNDSRARILNYGGIISHSGGTPYLVVTDRLTGKKTIRWLTKATNGKITGYTKPHKIKIPAFGWLKVDKTASLILNELEQQIKNELEEIKI